MNHLDFFSGIGGFSLAAQRVWGKEHNIIAFCENDKYCQKVLKKHWPDVPICERIEDLNGKEITQTIDILTGGWPCQPFSVAGKQRGKKDDRHLWPEMLRIIQETNPTWIIGENVTGIIDMELDNVLSDLEGEGYETQTFNIPACGVDARHKRERIWIVANSKQQGTSRQQENRTLSKDRGNEAQPDRVQTPTEINACRNSNSTREDVADTSRSELQRSSQEKIYEQRTLSGQFRRSGENIGAIWPVEPDVGGRFNGFPLWLYRCMGGLTYEESQRRTEVLRKLWKEDVSKALWENIGGFNQIQKSEILHAFVCEYERSANKAWLLLESKEGFVRGLWLQGKITGSPYRSRNKKQSQREYSDSLQELSRLLAYDGKENWQISSWEDGIPRVAQNVPNRAHRLKALGNAIVPQVVEVIMRGIKEIETGIV